MQEARWIDAELMNFNDLSIYDATKPRFNATMPTQCHDAESRQIRDEAESNTTQTRCHDAKRDGAKRDDATMPVRNADANVQRDDAARRCRLNATLQSQGRYETRQSLTRRRLDATVPRCHDAKRDDATMPVGDANVERDDATRRCPLNATVQSQGRV